MNKADIILEMGKKWIKKSSIGHVDRTAYIFVTELQEMGEKEKVDELYKFYESVT